MHGVNMKIISLTVFDPVYNFKKYQIEEGTVTRTTNFSATLIYLYETNRRNLETIVLIGDKLNSELISTPRIWHIEKQL
jgi:hypothetical protein